MQSFTDKHHEMITGVISVFDRLILKDRHFGFMHVRLSTWMPFTIQVYLNGHDWLARQLDAKRIAYEQVDNAFVSIANPRKAQEIADLFQRLPLEGILHVFANRVNLLLKTILSGMEYYWVIDQAEYATDVMFRNRAALKELYLNLQKHAAVCIQAQDFMSFMGRKLHGSFRGDITTDAKARVDVTRVKHVVKGNWIKMYNKHGIVLRIETVINRPQELPHLQTVSSWQQRRWMGSVAQTYQQHVEVCSDRLAGQRSIPRCIDGSG